MATRGHAACRKYCLLKFLIPSADNKHNVKIEVWKTGLDFLNFYLILKKWRQYGIV